MPASASDVGDSSSDLPRASGNAVPGDESFPKIAFTEPTAEEAQQISFFLFNEDDMTGHDLRSRFSDEEKGLKPLFVHDPSPDSIADDARIRAPASQSSSAAAGNDYVSFGDEGTTVTVNAFGNIIQISRSLGHGHSGLFCVDAEEICGSASSQLRLEQMMQMSKSPERGIRLEKLVGFGERAEFMQEKPDLEFIFNRWPRFISQPVTNSGTTQPPNREDSLVCLQYFCHKGTVFQRYTFHHDPNGPSALQRCLLSIRRNFLIRTLDLVKDSAFNRAGRHEEDYISLLGPKKLSHLWVHRMSRSNAVEIGIDGEQYQKADGPKAVAVIISVFINGKPQTLDPLSKSLYVDLIQETREELNSPGHVEITVAYRLQILKDIQSWKKSIIPACALDSMRSIFSEKQNASFHRIRWSSNDQVDFITGRSLEHILSVCSMPIPKHSSHTTKKDYPKGGEAMNDGDDMDATSLALTCGDISGHRIVSSAAFFAFEFLVEILRHLCDKSKEINETISNQENSLLKMGRFTDPERRKRYIEEIETEVRTCRGLSSHISELQDRIVRTLEAHLTWTANREKKEGYAVSNYWITGKEIGDWQNHRSFPPTSLTDVPFEIIKAYSLCKFYKTNKDLVRTFVDGGERNLQVWRDFDERKILSERLKAYIRPWLQRLYESDKSHQYAFPRGKKDGNKKYRLADHVWVCRAIKCVEELQMEELLDLEGGEQYLEYPLPEAKEISSHANGQAPKEQIRTSRSTELRRVVLKRFTTRNPQSQQRMLATSRTPSESRFLFHGTDTALLYAMDDGFFDQEEKTNNKRINWTNKIAVWKETVDVQAEHEETQTLDWEKPLWYTLALIISSKRKRINKTSADEMFNTTARILFALSSSSGLFPGFLNEKREPIPFEDELERDKYWHTTFEIPYALWMYGKAPLEASGNTAKLNNVGGRHEGKPEIKDSSQLRQPMTKKMEFANFNNLIDKSRLVEVSDDWLQEAPSSLNFDSETTFEDISSIQERRSDQDYSYGNVIDSALDSQSLADPSQLKGVVFDVPKDLPTSNIRQSELNLQRNLQPSRVIREILRGTRTAQKAKKRLIWLPWADRETALTCYLASPQMERDNLSAFFDRHASYDKHFYDETSAALNEWTTELHLSFFKRATWNPKKDSPEINRSVIPDLTFILVDPPTVPGQPKKELPSTQIFQSVMSFRFVGDFFDRYWTCHFLECDPTKVQSDEEYQKLRNSGDDAPERQDKGLKSLASRLSYLGTTPVKDMKNSGRKKQPWQQRKVLELLLFEYILGEIHSSTDDLLTWVQDAVLDRTSLSGSTNLFDENLVDLLQVPLTIEASKPLNPLAKSLQAGVQFFTGDVSDDYFSTAERRRIFDQVLLAMEDDLSRNLETISSWSSRERDRGSEKPRWTRNDEMTYRQLIIKLQVMNQKKLRDLESLREAIRAFRGSLSGKLDTMRSDLEYRGSENINLFTYVTVVFLPLGFATGVFSMSNSPDRETLVSMIQLALIAMAITLFALSNAKTTGKALVRPIIMVSRFINNRFLDPLLQPFYILGNFLLCCLMFVELFTLMMLYVALNLLLSDLSEQRGMSWIKRWKSKLAKLRHSYGNVVDFNKDVLSGRMVLDPAKFAREFIEGTKREKLRRPPVQTSERSQDEECGEAGQFTSANGGVNGQSH